MNTVPQEQLTPKQLDRLAAQRQLYSNAKAILSIQVTLSVPLAIFWSIIVLNFPSLKVFAALSGLSVTLLDAVFLSRYQKILKSQAAKVQELFDCDVLQMEWRDLKVGRRPDAEAIMEFSTKFRCKDTECESLQNWYSVEVGKVPLHVARTICQRTNCWWDAKLRRRYASWVITIVGIIVLFSLLVGLLGKFTLEEYILVILIPLLPVLLLGIRQYDEFNESAITSDRLKEHAEKLFNKAIAKTADPDEIAKESRELQDEIYDRRRNGPLVFDWLYRRLRKPMEDQMNKGAESLVEEAIRSIHK